MISKKYFLVKLICFILCFTLSSTNFINAGQKTLKKAKVERVTLKSELLKKKMNALVYLPKGYGDGQKYPVLYFIHGFRKNENLLIEAGFDQKASDLIESERIKPMIIVAPQVDNSWGLNSSDSCKEVVMGSDTFNYGMYEDYFFKEVIPYIEAKYSVQTERDGRYIGGSSMGGYISIYYGFRHTELFSKIGGHMPTVNLGARFSGFVFPTQESRMERDPANLAVSKDLTNVDIYLDCGKSDSLLYPVTKFYQALQDRGVKAQFNSSEGTHSTAYIKANVEKYLLFYAGK